MALGGAWVSQILGSNVVRLTGRTFGAAADTETIGPNGSGADYEWPAGWYGDDVAWATLAANVVVLWQAVTNSETAAVIAAGGILRVVKTADPFTIILTWDGDTPEGDVEVEVYVIWPHSVIQ